MADVLILITLGAGDLHMGDNGVGGRDTFIEAGEGDLLGGG
jgi:hypothetical protein